MDPSTGQWLQVQVWDTPTTGILWCPLLVQGLPFALRVSGLGFSVSGFGFREWGLDLGLGFRVLGLGFRV